MVDMSGRIQTDITLKKLQGQHWNKPFIQKNVYMNLLAELTQMLRLHGLVSDTGSSDGKVGTLHGDWASSHSREKEGQMHKRGLGLSAFMY